MVCRGILLMVVFSLFSQWAQAQPRYRVGYKDEGFTVLTEASILVPSGSFYRLGYNTQLVGGLLTGQWLLGAGASMDVYKSDFFVTPIATARYFFSKEQLTPFMMVDAGYSFPIDASAVIGGGPNVSPGLGIRYFATRSLGVNFALLYRFHSMPVDRGIQDESVALRTNFVHGIGFRIGMQF